LENSTIQEGNMRRIRIARKRKKEKKYAICPHCGTKIVCESKPGQKIRVKCHKCGKKGVIAFTEKKNGNYEKSKTRLIVPKKITLKKIIWVLFSFFITVTILSLLFIAATGNIYIDTFYVSIFIGIMVLREVTDEFIPNHLKKKINFIVSGFIIVFLLILVDEILSFIAI